MLMSGSAGQPGHDSSINALIVISADSRWVATGSKDGTIIVWDPESGRISQEWLAHPGSSGVYSLAFSVDNRYLVSASGCCSGTVEVWDLHHNASKAEALVDQYGKLDWRSGRCVCSANKQTLIAAETEGSHWHIWDGFTFQRLRLDNKWEGKLEALSSDGRWIVTSDPPGDSSQYLLWSVAGGQLYSKQLRGHKSSVHAVAFNPRSTRVVTGHSDCTIRICEVETGTELLLMQEEKGMWIQAVAYSPDGNLLLSRSTPFQEDDHNLDTVKIWDAHSGTLLARLDSLDDRAILSACFSPCGRYVASASRTGQALVWRARDGLCIAKVSAPGSEGSGRVEKVTVTPDGKWLCCGVDDGRVFFRRMCDLVPEEKEFA
ncbi:hypothetical protein GSI_09074 [Ganoderma sinense ZZ0214-1]|uniref:Uncharacterized protein n=1 Tax=Ganoderma sinense ZZ0214-1 TaxID=1077348 RepID=A0A2G8S5G5_9APHY|nr:hypothetical protein GSI_09074 [Ganoderma sinense ZZ0214-1]